MGDKQRNSQSRSSTISLDDYPDPSPSTILNLSNATWKDVSHNSRGQEGTAAITARKLAGEAKTFHRFPYLPLELQDEIWKTAIQAIKPVTVDGLWVTHLPTSHFGRIGDLRNHGGAKKAILLQLPTRMWAFPLFWTTRASRRWAISILGNPQRGDLNFLPHCDSLHFPFQPHLESDWGRNTPIVYGRLGDETLVLSNIVPGRIRGDWHEHSVARRCASFVPGAVSHLYAFERRLPHDAAESGPSVLRSAPAALGPPRFRELYGLIDAEVRLHLRSLSIDVPLVSPGTTDDFLRLPQWRSWKVWDMDFPVLETLTIFIRTGKNYHTFGLGRDADPREAFGRRVPRWWTAFIGQVLGFRDQLTSLKRVNIVWLHQSFNREG